MVGLSKSHGLGATVASYLWPSREVATALRGGRSGLAGGGEDSWWEFAMDSGLKAMTSGARRLLGFYNPETCLCCPQVTGRVKRFSHGTGFFMMWVLRVEFFHSHRKVLERLTRSLRLLTTCHFALSDLMWHCYSPESSIGCLFLFYKSPEEPKFPLLPTRVPCLCQACPGQLSDLKPLCSGATCCPSSSPCLGP